MTVGALALALATVALAALATSAAIAAALPALDAAAKRLSPPAAAAVWRAVLLAPWLVALATVAAVFGLVPDHCLAHGPHHPHLCLEHAAAWPSAGVAVIAFGIATRGLAWAARAVAQARRSYGVTRRLEAASILGPGGVRQIPGARPWAAAAGLVRPRIYLSEGMAADADAAVALEHERVHVRGRHPLWHWIAALATALHVPIVGRSIARRVAIAHEMEADDGAGRALGDRARVAATLVRLARERAPAAPGSLGLWSPSLETRVRALLSDSANASPAPRAAAIAIPAVAVAAVAGIAASAPGLHHAIETLFGHLG